MVSLLTLLDDIASTLDDVSVMTKIALKKTSAIMSDDLALNSAVVDGVNADRELPIVRSIFFGSLLNKVYCISAIMILSAVYAALISWVLLLGGLYLSFEGAHKVSEKLFGAKANEHDTSKSQRSERERIKGAIRTDLILSLEIIVIAQSSLSGSLIDQLISLAIVGVATSILIYGLVALLVKVDDLGLWLIKRGSTGTGRVLVAAMPYFMRGLGVIGTLAMFLVGGGIISHFFHIHINIPELLLNLILGFVAGSLLVGLGTLSMRLRLFFRKRY